MSEDNQSSGEPHAYAVEAFGQKFSYTFDGAVVQIASTPGTMKMSWDLRKGKPTLDRKRVFHPERQLVVMAPIRMSLFVFWKGFEDYVLYSLVIMAVILGYKIYKIGKPRWAWRIKVAPNEAFHVFEDPNEPERTERFVGPIRALLASSDSRP